MTNDPAVGGGDAPNAAEPSSKPLRTAIVAALQTCYDPEIPVDIYELGLIYSITFSAEDRVLIQMTLTSPMCPAAQSLPSEVKQKVESVAGVAHAEVEVVWEPPWEPAMMTEAARLQLGMF